MCPEGSAVPEARSAPAKAKSPTAGYILCDSAESMSSSEAAQCSVCGSAATKRCGMCRERRYCGEECQKSDWREHKLVCHEGLAVPQAIRERYDEQRALNQEFRPDTKGLLRLHDGRKGIDSIQWQFMKLERPESLEALRLCGCFTEPRAVWNAKFAAAEIRSLLEMARQRFIKNGPDADTEYFSGAVVLSEASGKPGATNIMTNEGDAKEVALIRRELSVDSQIALKRLGIQMGLKFLVSKVTKSGNEAICQLDMSKVMRHCVTLMVASVDSV